jgi:hypothetical protein
MAKESKLVKKVRRTKTINSTTVSINAKKMTGKLYNIYSNYNCMKKGTYISR